MNEVQKDITTNQRLYKNDPIYQKQQQIQQGKFTLRIKQLFLNFLLYLINDFEDFYKSDSKYGDKTSISEQTETSKDKKSAQSQATAHQIFDFKKYTKSENQKEFRERFVQSQAFIHFIEEAYHMDRGNVKQ